jgi:hypothetical protein
LQVNCRLFVEAGDVDIAHVVLGVVLHRLDVDHVADHLHFEWIVHAFAHDGKRDRRVYRSAHLLDSVLQGETLDLLLVESNDEITAL